MLGHVKTSQGLQKHLRPQRLFTTAGGVTSGMYVLIWLCPFFNLIEPEQQ